jgi:hypothetical protein
MNSALWITTIATKKQTSTKVIGTTKGFNTPHTSRAVRYTELTWATKCSACSTIPFAAGAAGVGVGTGAGLGAGIERLGALVEAVVGTVVEVFMVNLFVVMVDG